MRLCPSCATAVPPDHEFCGKCGTPVDGSPGDATETVHQPRSPSSSSKNMDEGRFPPGTLVAQRYRVVSLLGRGGMGEVYRANDLLLGQTVALKFLPLQWTSDESTLARFRNEVLIARQISHPNVCRMYDIGEAEGSTYLSMEYVDGEDLASLLRRIGAASCGRPMGGASQDPHQAVRRITLGSVLQLAFALFLQHRLPVQHYRDRRSASLCRRRD